MDDGQVSVNGLVMGDGTDYIITDFNPWTRQARVTGSGDNPWSDGSWAGTEFYESVVVNMGIHTIGTSAADWQAKHWALMRAFAPIRTSLVEAELRWVIGGVEYLMRGRPRMLSPKIQNINSGEITSSASFVALDPAIYSADEHTITMGLPAWAGGLTAPITAPVAITATQSDGIADATNTGIVPARLLLRITGPVTTPSVTVITPDGVPLTLTIDTELGTGDWIDIDTAERSVLLNGSISRLSSVYGTWPLLWPGTSTIRYRAAATNPDTHLTIRWRDQW